MIKKGIPYPWCQLADETYWNLGGLYPNRKFKWFKRKKVSQKMLDFLNGKPVKFRINLKDWKMTQITSI
jgi:hypothetical protein